MTKADKAGWTIIIFTLFFAFLLAYGLSYLDKKTMTNSSTEARIALLEKQMKDKIRPIIQINRAAVYNTDGEIVIETIEKKGKK